METEIRFYYSIDSKDNKFKSKMSEVYKKRVNDLELLVSNFKVVVQLYIMMKQVHIYILLVFQLNIKIKMVWKNKLVNQMYLLKNH